MLLSAQQATSVGLEACGTDQASQQGMTRMHCRISLPSIMDRCRLSSLMFGTTSPQRTLWVLF
jgi:hypothetical protein